MRPTLVALTIAAVACSTGPGTPDSIAGSWSSNLISLSLTQSGDQVAGTAYLAPNTYYVTGSYDRPNVKLALQYRVGGSVLSPLNLTGQAMSANTMVLILFDGPSTLHRQ